MDRGITEFDVGRTTISTRLQLGRWVLKMCQFCWLNFLGSNGRWRSY